MTDAAPEKLFERFTNRARNVMGLANQEAQRLARDYIDGEHVLLGLSKEGPGVGSYVLREMGATYEVLRDHAFNIFGVGEDDGSMGRLRSRPGARALVDAAIEESVSRNHNYVGTEHILLAICNTEGNARSVLEKVLKPDEVIRRVEQFFEDKRTDPAPSPASTAGAHKLLEKFGPSCGVLLVEGKGMADPIFINPYAAEAIDKRDALIAAQSVRLGEAEKFEELAFDLLVEVCARDDDNGDRFIDNQCLSTYEHACRVFEKAGRLKARNGRIYDIVDDAFLSGAKEACS